MELRDLHERLRRSPLSHPTRLAIMVLLAARHSIEYNELVRALGVTPGSLWGHVKLLEKRGLVKLAYTLTPRGPRLVVRVTREGIQETLDLLNALRMLEEVAVAAREAEANANTVGKAATGGRDIRVDNGTQDSK